MSAATDTSGGKGGRSSGASSWRRHNSGSSRGGRAAPTGVGAHYVGRAAPNLGSYGYGGHVTENKSRRSLFDAGSVGKSVRGLFGGSKQNFGKGLEEVDFNANLAPRRISGDAADVASSMFYDAPAAHHIANRAANKYRDPYGPDPISVRIRDGFDSMLDSMSDCLDSIYYAGSGCLDYTSRHMWKMLFLLAAVMLVVGASVTFTSRKAANGGANPSSIQRDAPLAGAVGSIHNKRRYKTIKNAITKQGISTSDDFRDKNSPQSRALYWISENDELQLAPDDPYMVQRYALVTFYYYSADAMAAFMEDDEIIDSRDDDDGKNDRNIRRRLQDTVGDSDEIKSAVGWKSTNRWMTKKGHCSWNGIECIHRPGSFDMDTIYDGTGSITIFNMTNNRVKGILPKEIGTAMKDLKVLDLGQNEMKGTIPSTVGEASELITLYLGDNDITVSTKCSRHRGYHFWRAFFLAPLHFLLTHSLTFHLSTVQGTIPSMLGQLSKCTHLFLDRNELDGPLPNELSNLSEMTMLGLHQNNLSGSIPDFSSMTKLRALYLDSNDLTSTIPTSIGELTSLIDFRLGSNELTGTLPTELGNLENLRDLHIQRNKLSGSLPLSFAGMKNLHEFHAYSNKLSGKIPMQIGFLGFFSQLKVLYLDDNELTGTIPSSLANVRGLVDLYLSKNHLEGPIPKTLSQQSDLKNLRLNDNQLTGTIPVELDKLQKLEYLYLQNNRLEGPIPNELGVLNKLFRFRSHGNSLTGTMPRGVCHLRGLHLEELQADCDGVTPRMECTCCTTCY